MRTIRLFNYTILEKNLTWMQVQNAIKLAKATEASKYYRFFENADEHANHPVKRWMLCAMPNIYYEHISNGKDISDWYISIDDTNDWD